MIIHIGIGKSGTTTLQQAMDRVPGVLGLAQPRPVEAYAAFAAALAEPRFDLTVARGLQLAVTHHESRVVISDETLARPGLAMVGIADRLKIAFPSAEILITVRNQLTAIPSYYGNHGRTLKGVPAPYDGRHVTFPDWWIWASRSPSQTFLGLLDYATVRAVYAERFAAVHTLMFEEMVEDRPSFCRQLAEVLGVTPGAVEAAFATTPRQNARDSAREVALLRWKQRLVGSAKLPGMGRVKRWAKGGKGVEVVLDDATRAAIHDLYAHSNARLAAATGLPLQRYGYPMVSQGNGCR